MPPITSAHVLFGKSWEEYRTEVNARHQSDDDQIPAFANPNVDNVRFERNGLKTFAQDLFTPAKFQELFESRQKLADAKANVAAYRYPVTNAYGREEPKQLEGDYANTNDDGSGQDLGFLARYRAAKTAFDALSPEQKLITPATATTATPVPPAKVRFDALNAEVANREHVKKFLDYEKTVQTMENAWNEKYKASLPYNQINELIGARDRAISQFGGIGDLRTKLEGVVTEDKLQAQLSQIATRFEKAIKDNPQTAAASGTPASQTDLEAAKAEGKKGMKKWLIGVGVGSLVLDVGLAAGWAYSSSKQHKIQAQYDSLKAQVASLVTAMQQSQDNSGGGGASGGYGAGGGGSQFAAQPPMVGVH
jgi:hypothetical protein